MEYSLAPSNSDKLAGLVTHFFCFSTSSGLREDRKMIPSGRQYILFVPSGEVEFFFRNNKQLKCNRIAVVSGISDYSISYHAQPGTVILGASLVANGLFRLLGGDLTKLTAPKMESREFLKNHELQDVLDELLLVANDRKKQYKIIEAYLMSKAGAHSESYIDDCIQAITDAKGDIRMEELARKALVSSLQLESEFIRQTGITPDKYIRLIRFKYAFAEFVNDMSDPGELVIQYNYEDYAQFLQDFKQYTGHQPKSIRPEDFTSYNAYRKELKRLGAQFLI